MTGLRIYGIKNCDTMKKAMRWLEERGLAYEFIDYKKAGVVTSHLPDWMARAGWETLLNTRGLMWKKLRNDQRADIDESKALTLLQDYPSMIKRPVLDTGEHLIVGFDPERYNAELK